VFMEYFVLGKDTTFVIGNLLEIQDITIP
jgi:hypothetical protein